MEDVARTTDNTPTTDERMAAEMVSEQYAKVCGSVAASVREMVVFGAMLDEVDASLAASGAGRNGADRRFRGLSLRGWLEANCPEVNYKTAMGYRAAARGTLKLAKIGKDAPLLRLLDENPIADREQEKDRLAVLKVMEEHSMRVLRSAANGGGKTGRPPAKEGADGYVGIPAADSAVAAVWKAIEPFLIHRGALASAVKLVPVDKLAEARDTLMEFTAVLEAEIEAR